jgi:hypothetical protein
MAKLEVKVEETIERQMEHFLSYVDGSAQNLPEAKKTVPDPEMIQSVKEDQEAPREKAAIMSKD